MPGGCGREHSIGGRQVRELSELGFGGDIQRDERLSLLKSALPAG
jgi:hypothetical protein